MEMFKSVKTYIGLLSAIVGALVIIYQDTLKSGLLKDASDLIGLIALVFFIITAVLFVLGYLEVSKKEIAAEQKRAEEESKANLELEKAKLEVEKEKLALEKAKAELDAKKGAIIKGKGSTLAKATITNSNDALIDAEESEGGEFEINNANAETTSENEKKNNPTD